MDQLNEVPWYKRLGYDKVITFKSPSSDEYCRLVLEWHKAHQEVKRLSTPKFPLWFIPLLT